MRKDHGTEGGTADRNKHAGVVSEESGMSLFFRTA